MVPLASERSAGVLGPFAVDMAVGWKVHARILAEAAAGMATAPMLAPLRPLPEAS